jgi:hypothetical protein
MKIPEKDKTIVKTDEILEDTSMAHKLSTVQQTKRALKCPFCVYPFSTKDHRVYCCSFAFFLSTSILDGPAADTIKSKHIKIPFEREAPPP